MKTVSGKPKKVESLSYSTFRTTMIRGSFVNLMFYIININCRRLNCVIKGSLYFGQSIKENLTLPYVSTD